MINDLGNCHKETVIAINEKEAKKNVQSFNPNLSVLKANWINK